MAILLFTLLPLLFSLTSALDAPGFAQRVEVGLNKRYGYAGGGWALQAKSCPAGYEFNDCDSSCCPHSLPWQASNGCEPSTGRACCPPGEECEDAIAATPFCADSTWVLWNTTSDGSYFCCLPGQQGTDSLACVDGQSVVASTLLAQKLGAPVPTGGASATATYSVSGTGADATSGPAATSGSAATTETSGTTTAKTSPSSTKSGGAIIHSIVSSVTHSGAVPARPFQIGSTAMSISGVLLAGFIAGVGVYGGL